MLIYILVTISIIQAGLSYFMPGTIPSSATPTMEGCQNEAEAFSGSNFTSNYTSPYAVAIQHWCSMYDEVLDCVDMSLPYTRMTHSDDWFLSMMFDLDIAKNMSEDICSKWEEYAKDMDCMERSRRKSNLCIKFQTNHLSTTLLQLYHKNLTDNPHADVNACLYTNYTTNCMTKHMQYCSEPVRHIIHKYFRLLNGKCDAILLENILEHRNKSVATTSKRQKIAEKVKAILQARRKNINNSRQLQETIKDIFKQNSVQNNTATDTGNSTLLETNTNSTGFIDANSTGSLTRMFDMNTNFTVRIKPTRKSRKRKKTKKSKAIKVKSQLKKLFKLVMQNI